MNDKESSSKVKDTLLKHAGGIPLAILVGSLGCYLVSSAVDNYRRLTGQQPIFVTSSNQRHHSAQSFPPISDAERCFYMVVNNPKGHASLSKTLAVHQQLRDISGVDTTRFRIIDPTHAAQIDSDGQVYPDIGSYRGHDASVRDDYRAGSLICYPTRRLP